MIQAPVAALSVHFANLEDSRVERTKDHSLINIITIAICSVICGANGWTDMELFGYAKQDWLSTFLDLKNGIPSHDTFGRVFGMIDPEQFKTCFVSWIQAIVKLANEEIIALDGKCLRRSHDKTSGKEAIYMVSAWATENQLVLGQQKVDEKSNEITAIPRLLLQLDIAGAVITMDAMGCQTAVATQIIEQKADYMLSLKGNQGNLHKDVKLVFESENTCPAVGYESYDVGHGRIETRTVRASSDIEWLKKQHPKWAGLKSIVAVTAKREYNDKITEETRYFISSLDATNPKYLGHVVRAHWGIENNLHWVLDYAFDEDSQRTRMGNSAANMSIIRHISLNLLKSESTAKVGIKNKRLKAGWDNEYLLKVLFSMNKK